MSLNDDKKKTMDRMSRTVHGGKRMIDINSWAR